MNMKRLLSLVALFATLQASAQQVNPVPDYVFRNQMSVGRNAVTDTAAYFSIGPRYGATKGFMPPIVGDTATFSSGKRNGLLIFSVQKNKFLYWDSVRVQWSDMAGSSGSYIVAGDTSAMLAPYLRKADTTSMLTAYLRKGDTASMLSPYYRSATATAALALKLNISDTSSMLGNYVRHAGYGLTKSGQSFLVDTAAMATRARVQKGIDSLAAIGIAGSGTINRSAKFTATGSIGNGGIADSSSSVAMTILSSGNVGIGTQAPSSRLHVSGGDVRIDNTRSYNFTNNSGGTSSARLQMFSDNNLYVDNPDGAINFRTQSFESAMIITNGKNVGIGTTTPSQKLDVIGIITNNNSAYFATSSGNVGVGTTSPSQKFSVNGIGAFNTRLVFNGFNQLVGDGNQFNDGGGISGFGIRNDSGQVMLAAGGNTPQLRVSKSGEILINTNTDAGDYKIQVNGNSLFSGNIRTAAPTGGTANDWRLGTVATVSPTSPNRTIEVSIGGTIYYIHAKTTND